MVETGMSAAQGWRQYFFYFAHLRPSALRP